MEMETREFEIRAVNKETRELEGIAVPYGEVIDLGGFKERFERGAFGDKVEGPLFYGHEHRSTGGAPIGRVVSAEDTDEGLLVRAKISDTPRGNEVYTLLRDGVLNKFSVGFNPVESRMEEDVLVRTAAEFLEVSVTPFPAYKTAAISEVRSEVTNDKKKEDSSMETTNTDVADLRDTVTDLERRIAVMQERHESNANQGSQFRSGGELLKALAAGDDNARAEFRAADGTGPATSAQAGADAYNGWIARPLKLVNEKRRTINLFSRGPLPSHGNTVEYPVVKETAGTVEKQASEGAALSYMEIELGTGTATVGTYGGYSRLSRQAIERSDLAYLDAVLRYQALQYAKATEADVRAAVLGVKSAADITLAADTAADWIDVVVDSAAQVEDESLGLQAEFILVSRDVFKRIAHMEDNTGRPIFALREGGQNVIGSANLVNASANIGGLPVVVDPTLPANTTLVASSEAVTTLESPGAPFRLQDESVINLTKDFSLYGYMAKTVNDASGIVRVDVDLV